MQLLVLNLRSFTGSAHTFASSFRVPRRSQFTTSYPPRRRVSLSSVPGPSQYFPQRCVLGAACWCVWSQQWSLTLEAYSARGLSIEWYIQRLPLSYWLFQKTLGLDSFACCCSTRSTRPFSRVELAFESPSVFVSFRAGCSCLPFSRGVGEWSRSRGWLRAGIIVWVWVSIMKAVGSWGQSYLARMGFAGWYASLKLLGIQNSLMFWSMACLGLAMASKLFLLGGYQEQGDTLIFQEIARQTGRVLAKDCGENWVVTACVRVAIVTSGAQNCADGTAEYEQVQSDGSPPLKKIFTDLGFFPMHITLHQDNYQTHASPSSPEGERNLDLLRLADLVYFDGGDQSRISNSWLQADGRYSALLQFLFLRYSRGELVVAGTSAGNAFMSDVSHGEGSAFGVLYFANKVDLADKKIYSPTGLADDRNGTQEGSLQYEYNGGLMKASGFMRSEYVLDTHFDDRGRTLRILPAMRHLNKSLGLGVNAHSAVLVQDNRKARVVAGKALLFDSREAEYSDRMSTQFGVNKVKVSLLTPGDQVDLQNCQITTNKSRIQQHKYQEALNSTKINSPGQVVPMLQHLVNQVPQQSFGWTSLPEDFPPETGVWTVTLKRGSTSLGYQDALATSAFNIELSLEWSGSSSKQ